METTGGRVLTQAEVLLAKEEAYAKLTAANAELERENARLTAEVERLKEERKEESALYAQSLRCHDGITKLLQESRAENTRLKAPVSDDEWYAIWNAGMCLGMMGNEGATKEGFNAILASRITRTPPQ